VPPRNEVKREMKDPGTVIGQLPASIHARERVDAARVTGRGTWGPARRARCRAPGANAPHAGARARGGGWCAGYAERKADQGAAVESGSAARRLRESATTEHVYSRAQVVAHEPQQAA
jgi:hypothetical protein